MISNETVCAGFAVVFLCGKWWHQLGGSDSVTEDTALDDAPVERNGIHFLFPMWVGSRLPPSCLEVRVCR